MTTGMPWHSGTGYIKGLCNEALRVRRPNSTIRALIEQDSLELDIAAFNPSLTALSLPPNSWCGIIPHPPFAH
ncbi:MAG: hypothetical protein WAN11_24405, partial [Syntrophobacteraceae bacterium]